jgi:NADH:ubiquinone oxidoreductase subunit E
MLEVHICVGSSCHLKGSYYVIRTFQELIRRNSLEDKVEIKASFCLGHCTKGVSVKIRDEFVEDLTPENVEEKFREYVLERL